MSSSHLGKIASHPDDTVTYRDLGRNPVPHVDEPWIAAAFSSPDTHTPEFKQAIKVSNTLIDELLPCLRSHCFWRKDAIAQAVANW